MSKYSKGKIYTIRCRTDDTLIYVGSTIQPLSHRWGGHKCDVKHNPNMLLYKTINNDWDNWYIELYEDYPCENKEQLLKKEGEIIRLIATLNQRIAGRSKKEYRIDNVDISKEYQKQYNIDNVDVIKEKQKLYRTKNTDVISIQKRQYYINNEDKIKEYNKKYRDENRDKKKEYMKQYYLKKKQEKND